MPVDGFVLVVDDDDETVEALYALSKEIGPLALTTASSGEEATSLMERYSFQAVITDLKMPDMDGVQLLRTIHERWPNTLTIIMSGTPLDAFKNRLRGLPLHAYLRKPFDRDQFLALLATIPPPKSPTRPLPASLPKGSLRPSKTVRLRREDVALRPAGMDA